MPNLSDEAYESEYERLSEQIDTALAQNKTIKADRLSEQQRALISRRDGDMEIGPGTSFSGGRQL